MKGVALEAFFARLLVDPLARARFAVDPIAEGRRARLDAEECRALLDLDRVGLELAASSFASKRRRAELASAQALGALRRMTRRVLATVLRRG
jgi:hypothetical protein